MAKLKAIDTIGKLNAEIAKLVAQRDKLVDRVKDYRGVGEYEGEEYIGTVYESESCTPNVAKLKKLLGDRWRKYVVVKPYIALKVESRAKKELAAAKKVARTKIKKEKDNG